MMANKLPPSPAYIRSLEAYKSGRSILKGENWIRMDSGECSQAFPYDASSLPGINWYPDPTADALRDAIANFYSLTRDNVFVSCGIDELIELSIKTFSAPGSTVLAFDPTFPLYRISAESQGRTYISVNLDQDFTVDAERAADAAARADVVFLCSPNNPTGTVLDSSVIDAVIKSAKGLVVIDEAYGEFLEVQKRQTCMEFVQCGSKNVLVTRTFSKAFASAGIRLGYGIADEEIIAQLLKTKLPYNVNALSQSIGLALWQQRDRMEENVESLIRERQRLTDGCKKLGCTVSDSVTHFFLLQFPDGVSAKDLYTYLLKQHQLAVRQFGVINRKESLRVSTGTPEQNNLFLSALNSFISS